MLKAILFIFSLLQMLISSYAFSAPKTQIDTSNHFSSGWYQLPPVSVVLSRVHHRLKSEMSFTDEDLKDVKIKRISISDFYQVLVGERVFLTDENAQFWVSSKDLSVYNLSSGFQTIGLTNDARDQLIGAISLLSAEQSSAIVFPSLSNVRKKIIYAFMDLSCPHSKSFHLKDRTQLQLKGVEFRYIPVVQKNATRWIAEASEGIWCKMNGNKAISVIDDIYLSDTPQSAWYSKGMDLSKSQKCDGYNAAFYNFSKGLNEQFSFKGTPFFVDETGAVYYGVTALTNGIN